MNKLHPDFVDFSPNNERAVQQSQTFALWAIAAELNELNENLSENKDE